MGIGRRMVVGAAFALWALVAAGWAGYLTLERGLMSDTSCPFDETSSNYGEASWNWSPPGVTCTWSGVSFRGTEYVVVDDPPFGRSVIGGVLVVWGVSLFAVASASRRSNGRADDSEDRFDRGRIAR